MKFDKNFSLFVKIKRKKKRKIVSSFKIKGRNIDLQINCNKYSSYIRLSSPGILLFDFCSWSKSKKKLIFLTTHSFFFLSKIK